MLITVMMTLIAVVGVAIFLRMPVMILDKGKHAGGKEL
ncbi:putative membrane protein [Yersinia ruckeri]|nr:putative membrane protein [Yersinia ruckeri]